MNEIASHHDSGPLACNLSAGDLQQRLAAIADVGAKFLLTSEDGRDGHLLRFRASAEARRRLEEIVAAESECCPFLGLSLREENDEILLSILSPPEGRAVADELADSFAASGTADRSARRKRLGVLLSAGGAAVAVCCLVTPVMFGVALGAGLGGGLDAIAIALIVTGVAILVLRRRRADSGQQPCC